MTEHPEEARETANVQAEDGPSLETRLRRLEEIVGKLETEDLELDRALALFEEGVTHVKGAERALAAAELRVEELLGDSGAVRPLEDEA